jgi:hypothetical protein
MSLETPTVPQSEWVSYENDDGVWTVTRVIRARRVSPGFDTTAEAYDWLNDTVHA